MSHIMKRSSKLVNLQPQVCFCETSVSRVAFKHVNGDGMLTVPAPAPAPAPQPLLNGIRMSLIAADGSAAASGVTHSTRNFVPRAQLQLSSSLNPCVAMRVTVSKACCVSACALPINPTQVCTAQHACHAAPPRPLLLTRSPHRSAITC